MAKGTKQYRVVGIIEGGMHFNTKIIGKTKWFDTYEEAKVKKEEFETHDDEMIKKGYGFFIGYYRIQERKMDWIFNYVD